MACYKCGSIHPTQNSNVVVDTASGSVANFETDLALPLKSLEVDVNAVQDLHGYSKPWIGGAGKNKCDILDKTFTNNGTSVVCSKANQTVTITNTATSSGGRTQALTNVIHLTAGTYRPSATVVSGTLQIQAIRPYNSVK